jgi:hypothetical protein
MTDPDLIRALSPLVHVFDQSCIPYYVSGSLASSVFGIARATIDVDLVAVIEMQHIDVLKTRLQGQYYIDEVMIAEAISHRSSFNVIHLETSIKIDVFIPADELYARTAMDRRRADTLSEAQASQEFFFCSTEDIILHKLLWYQSGGGVSERQWLDVLGVIKVQADSLDKEYLKRWSKELGVFELLQRAFLEGGVSL